MCMFSKKKKTDTDIEEFKYELTEFLMDKGFLSPEDAIKIASETINKNRKKFLEGC